MSKIDDGWPLFRWDTELATECGVATGMTLRDYFAARAMGGTLSNSAFHDDDHEALSKWAYEMADAMLKAREESHGKA